MVLQQMSATHGQLQDVLAANWMMGNPAAFDFIVTSSDLERIRPMISNIHNWVGYELESSGDLWVLGHLSKVGTIASCLSLGLVLG